jgi:hypothetical protein
MIFIPPIYILLNIIHAWWHWYLIVKQNKTITSSQKAFEYGLISLLTFIPLLAFEKALPLIILPILTRAAFYDGLLNLFRGKAFLYEGQISKKKSVVDWIEDKIGLPTIIFRLLYALIYIGYLIFYLVKH